MCARPVTSFAFCQCQFGGAPSVLNATSSPKVLIENKPAATIMDMGPSNIISFVTCTSPANPSVAAAGGAPMPCKPVPAPWTPGQPKVLINNKPALTDSSRAPCAMAAGAPVISIMNPATTHTQC